MKKFRPLRFAIGATVVTVAVVVPVVLTTSCETRSYDEIMKDDTEKILKKLGDIEKAIKDNGAWQTIQK